MPLVKNAYLRYLELDKCLSNIGVQYTIDDLVKECSRALKNNDADSSGIKRRQVYMDLEFMESEEGYAAPIERKWVRINGKNRVIIGYSDPKFSIHKTPFSREDAASLKMTLDILEQFSNMPQYAMIDEMYTRLSDVFKLESDKGESFISFESNEYLKGRDRLGQLYELIKHQKVIKLTYTPFNLDTEVLFVHPYYLKEFNNRWFMFAYCEEKDEVHNYALDRISKVEEWSSKDFIHYKKVDFEDRFDQIVGVSFYEDNVLMDVELLFIPQQANYVLTKPLHHSQTTLKNDDDGLLISLKVRHNFELEQMLLSFGERVKVLRPQSLSDTIRERLLNAASNYK